MNDKAKNAKAHADPSPSTGSVCPVCHGSGTTDGAMGFNGLGPCPKCRPETWGPYDRRGDWYVLTPNDIGEPPCEERKGNE